MGRMRSFIDNLLDQFLQIPHVRDMYERNIWLYNINLSGLNGQKSVLICFQNNAFFLDGSSFHRHPSFFQTIQAISFFSRFGYRIDVCNYCDTRVRKKAKEYYDVIFGQGNAFDLAIASIKHRAAILFLTENNPETVKQKYQERVDYFIQRHPGINPNLSVKRMGIFSHSSITGADAVIAMTNKNNAQSLYPLCKSVFLVNVNALSNKRFKVEMLHLQKPKKSFLWFGSVGLIHKGLDVLMDTFARLPECVLNIYGIPASEKKLFNKLKRPNTVFHPFVDVLSERFINEVVAENTFVISNSCSEGMQSSIGTCMMCGLIPILSKECGYDAHESIILMDDFHVECVQATILKAVSMGENEIIRMRESAYEYSLKNFTETVFSIQMEQALNNALSSLD